MKKFHFLRYLGCLALALSVSGLKAQGCSVDTGSVCLCSAFPVASADFTYKSQAPAIDEIDPPIYEALKIRLYHPVGLPPGVRTPLIVLVHGGGFIAGSYSDYFALAESMAARGVAVASVQYRLCKRGDCLLAAGVPLLGLCNISWNNSLVVASYVAAVDVSDAIRFLQDRADEYSFDPDRVIVGGHSAGGFTALNVAFADTEEFQQVCAACGDGSNTYYGDSLQHVDGLQGIFPLSGAIMDTAWIEAQEAAEVRVFMAHGTHDETVPYGSGGVFCCPCGNTYPSVYGSGAVARRLKGFSGSNFYLLTCEGGSHDVGLNDFFDTYIAPQFNAFFVKSILEGAVVRKHARLAGCGPATVCGLPGINYCADPASTLPASGLFTVNNCACPGGTACFSNWEEPVQEGKFKIFPNPAGDAVVIAVQEGLWQAVIHDFTGREIKNLSFSGGNTRVSLSDLVPGVYWVAVRSQGMGAPFIKRLIISR